MLCVTLGVGQISELGPLAVGPANWLRRVTRKPNAWANLSGYGEIQIPRFQFREVERDVSFEHAFSSSIISDPDR